MPNGGMVNGHMTRDTSVNNGCIDSSLGMPQCGYSFSHPWSRLVTVVRTIVFDRCSPSLDNNCALRFIESY